MMECFLQGVNIFTNLPFLPMVFVAFPDRGKRYASLE